MFNARYDKTLAICDSELIGRKFKEDETVLDLKKHSSFYGDFVEEETVKQWIAKAFKERTSMNLVGEKTVNLTRDVLKINPKTLKVQGIPLLQIYFL